MHRDVEKNIIQYKKENLSSKMLQKKYKALNIIRNDI